MEKNACKLVNVNLHMNIDYVPAGAVLARVNGADYQAAANAAAAQSSTASDNVELAQSKLIQANAARVQARYAITEARSALSAAQEERDQAVAVVNQAEAAVSAAQSQVNLAQETYQRTSTLFQSGSATKPQNDDAKTAYDAAQDNLKSAQQAQAASLDKAAEANDQIKTAQARITQAEAGLESAKANVSAGEAAELAAESQSNQSVAAQQAQNVPLAETAITAPFSGIVLAKRVEEGSLVAPGVPAFVVADTSKYDVVFGLPEAEASGLHVDEAESLDIGNKNLHGIVTEIAPTADGKTGVFDVKVTVPGGNSAIKIGMVASLDLGHDAGVRLTAPLSALVPSNDHSQGFAVFVVADENGQTTAHIRDIDVKQVLGNNVVVDGLPRGTKIVSTAPGLLFDGESVTVTDASAEADNGLR